MRVLALGGAGRIGRNVVRLLASNSLVTEIWVAGRNPDAVQRVARETGQKATGVQLDIADHDRLADTAKGCDILVNAAGPESETIFNALEAAIDAGTNYCDICADGPVLEKAMKLNPRAKANGVTALMGIGYVPGLSNLMMLHAARQLETVEEVRCCLYVASAGMGHWKEGLKKARETNNAGAMWQAFMKWGTPPFHTYQGGELVDVDPAQTRMTMVIPQGGEVSVVPVASTEPITLPRAIPGVRDVGTFVSWFPPHLNELYREFGARIARGETRIPEAALAFLESLVEDHDRREPVPSGFPNRTLLWVEALGTRKDERVAYACWPASDWCSYVATLGLATLKILGGEIKTPGILAPEDCLDSLPFFKEVARHTLENPEPGALLKEAWRTL